jgi:hypothetical protein
LPRPGRHSTFVLFNRLVVMKTPFHTIFTVVGLLLQGLLPAATLHKPVCASRVCWLDPWLDDALQEYQFLEETYAAMAAPLFQRLTEVHTKLNATKKRTTSKTIRLLLEERALEDSLQKINDAFTLKVVRLRYRKSIEIMKMLYEKILSMDHHFSSMLVQQELSNLSNPHHYPEFEKARDQIEDKVKQKYGFVLPNLLSGNPFLSASFSIIGLMVTGGDAKRKQERTDKMACVLDFTVRMYTDLNTIHFETGFLRDANLALKSDCELLFADCARQVGYNVPLEQCRNGDDWEKLYISLDSLVEQTQRGSGLPLSSADQQKAERVANNLQFAVDRVIQFINRYSNFVDAGNGYYKKFDHITGSYVAEQECRDVLPDPFLQLRADIGQM